MPPWRSVTPPTGLCSRQHKSPTMYHVGQDRLEVGKCHFTKKTYNETTHKAPLQYTTIWSFLKSSQHTLSQSSHIRNKGLTVLSANQGYTRKGMAVLRTYRYTHRQAQQNPLLLKWKFLYPKDNLQFILDFDLFFFLTVKSIGSCLETMNGSTHFCQTTTGNFQ